jgi:hypothetical protein
MQRAMVMLSLSFVVLGLVGFVLAQVLGVLRGTREIRSRERGRDFKNIPLAAPGPLLALPGSGILVQQGMANCSWSVGTAKDGDRDQRRQPRRRARSVVKRKRRRGMPWPIDIRLIR